MYNVQNKLDRNVWNISWTLNVANIKVLTQISWLKWQYNGQYARKQNFCVFLILQVVITEMDPVMPHTHVKISQLVNKICVRNRLVASLSTSCNNGVASSSYYKVVTHNLLNCRTITSCWNNMQQVCWAQQPCSTLSTSRIDNLSTSWEQAVRTHPVDKLLEQYCHKSAAGLLQLVPLCVLRV
jgi:hypothetical protein